MLTGSSGRVEEHLDDLRLNREIRQLEEQLEEQNSKVTSNQLRKIPASGEKSKSEGTGSTVRYQQQPRTGRGSPIESTDSSVRRSMGGSSGETECEP
jgi:hypothetical protein